MKKISKLQVLRFVIQIGFLFFLPSLFTLTFGELKQLYSMIASGNFNFTAALPQLLEAIVVIPATILLGRFFCGWICAFGTFNDIIYLLSNRLFKTKFIVKEKVDSVLKYLKYVVLLFIIFLAWIKGISLDSYSPWNAFAQSTEFTETIFLYPVGFGILALIVVGTIFIERFFCRYLCPLGAIFSITSKLRLLRINKNREKCGKCRICTNNCSMGIKLYEVDVVNSGECINCMKCISSCPRSNTELKIVGKKVNPAFVSGAIILSFIAIYSLSTILVAKSNVALSTDTNLSKTENSISENNNSTSSTEGKKYKDGTYEGTGRGYRPNLKVSVTIKNDKITDVQILSNNETPRYTTIPFDTIPKEIIDSQSTDVDTISGATRTSNGIMEAVEDALSQAKTGGSGESSATKESGNQSTDESNNSGRYDGKEIYPGEEYNKNNAPNDNFGDNLSPRFDGNRRQRHR
ncbi:4Fe-4S binding protein [Clostridium sp. A1-XYC3]|uniref:4Fe-4S binding protein n=1 Tax=Clostridium tanneri TaxID=3037988 RepID=A0ABU4JVS8_9CLOT|nr:FMN-binding protein [Clostridium sp. A1-XYC3]MDW8802212.1 4Fe-4S binding protein [Clostridium sp. A1-XYC3]